MADKPFELSFTYRNYRGEISNRRVIPISIRYGRSEWHPDLCWLLLAHDIDKDAEREFSMIDILSFDCPETHSEND